MLATNLYTVFFLKRLYHVPRVMDKCFRDVFQLWYPHLDVLSVRVEFSRLKHRVELENTASANARTTSPATVVRLDIVIDELLFEVVGTIAPILLQIHAEVAGSDHTATIWHESCLVHLSHQCVDEWHPCHSILPTLYNVEVSLPGVIPPVVDSIAAENLIAIVHTPVALKVPPK